MKKFDSINVIPFIDIMLVLLAIVLMTASFISQGKINVNTPNSNTTNPLSATDVNQDVRLITVDKDSKIFLDDEEISHQELTNRIAEWEIEQIVHLKFDSKTPFEEFIFVGDLLRKQRISKVNIIATPIKNE